MLEKYLIEHCAPTLASLKTASLFSYHAAQDPEDDVKHLNRIFRNKGVELLILKREENAMLIYVCRRTQLAKDLERPGAKELLERYGYTDTSVDGAIERLRMRLASGDVTDVNSEYVLNKSMSFSSPSSAAMFVLGASANGWAEWKSKDGKTLDKLFRK